MAEWFSKIISVVKIPLRILLPTVCLFSAFFVFATDEVLDKLGMLTWSKDNKFAFGISFIISMCLLLVYCISFIKSKLVEIYRNKTLNKKMNYNIYSFSSELIGFFTSISSFSTSKFISFSSFFLR